MQQIHKLYFNYVSILICCNLLIDSEFHEMHSFFFDQWTKAFAPSILGIFLLLVWFISFLHAIRKPIKIEKIFCMTIKIRRWNLFAKKLWILTSCCGCQWGIPPTRTICIEALLRCWMCTDGRLWMTCKICSIIW